MFLVGLTGNYGMGKSTVLPIFEKCGAVIISTDEIVGSLLKEEGILDQIKGLFGEGVFVEGGRLSKKKIADVVFRDDRMRRSLEDILHPLVFERIDFFLSTIRDLDKVVVIEIPLLFERGYERRFDKIITVYTDEETVLNRVKRDGILREEALLRLKSQLPIEEKIERSDFVVDNNGTIEDTMSQVEAICKELLKEAKRYGNNKGT